MWHGKEPSTAMSAEYGPKFADLRWKWRRFHMREVLPIEMNIWTNVNPPCPRKYGWNYLSGSMCILPLLPVGERHGPYYEESWINKDAVYQDWLGMPLWIWRRFLKFVSVFLLFIISHWKRAWKLEFPSPQNTLCQVWLKLPLWFWKFFLKSCQCIFSVSQFSPFWREHGLCCVGGPFLSPICRNKLHTVKLWIKYTNDIHEKKQRLYLQRNLNFFCIHTIINLYPFKDNMTRNQISQMRIYIFFRSVREYTV